MSMFPGSYYYLGNSDIIFPKSMYLRVMSISRTINLKSIYVENVDGPNENQRFIVSTLFRPYKVA